MSKCVLIYDDDKEILFLCKVILENIDYRVETLSYCENIIDDIERIRPDVILMDLWITKIGGEKAIQLLKNNAATRHVPVIIFSADAELKEISKKINANDHLEKPFDINVFKEIIAKNIL